MKKTILTIVGITIVVLTGMSFTACHHRGAWFDDGPADHAERERRANYVKARIADRLELSDAQKSELDRMVDDLQAKHDEIESQRSELRAQFMELLRQDHLEAEQITNLVDSKRPEFEELLSLVAEKIAEFHNMLTPDQRTKLIAEMESHAQRCPLGR
jgi:Spy/CpxP family protein refolding chaperone